MPSPIPPDETPTLARAPSRRSLPLTEAATVVSTPSRSLWEAALAGHEEALAQILGRCGQAVYAWWRVQGSDPAEALSRTGNFLALVQTAQRPKPAEEAVDRLQDFMLRRLTDFVAMGIPEVGGTNPSELPVFDQTQAERRYLREAGRTPEDVFARRWALGTLELTIETLIEEFTNEGKGALIPHLRQFLSFNAGEEHYAKVAEETGTSVSALHVLVYRFRQRYREILRRLVGDTVRNPEDVDTELTKLLVSAS